MLGLVTILSYAYFLRLQTYVLYVEVVLNSLGASSRARVGFIVGQMNLVSLFISSPSALGLLMG